MISDLQQKIIKLKKEKNIAILAHSYQSPEILEIADIKGDSFKLSVDAKDIKQNTIIMAGVRFMADTVKILSPEKTVILPNQQATCPMAEQISPERVLEYKKQNPMHKVIAYVNTTTELKAVCDVCVTSSSALKIINNIEQDNILFIPDKNLGGYIKQKCKNKNIILWEGNCPIHNSVTQEDCENIIKKYPNARVLMHPEMPTNLLKYADVVGATSTIIDYALNNDCDCIIGTEKGVCDYLSLMKPKNNFYLLSKKLMCPDMRMITLIDIYKSMLGDSGEVIEIDEKLRIQAKKSIDKMIELAK